MQVSPPALPMRVSEKFSLMSRAVYNGHHMCARRTGTPRNSSMMRNRYRPCSGPARTAARNRLRMLWSLRKPEIRLAVTGYARDRFLTLLECRIPAIARPGFALAAKRIVVCGRRLRSKKRDCRGGRGDQKDFRYRHDSISEAAAIYSVWTKRSPGPRNASSNE